MRQLTMKLPTLLSALVFATALGTAPLVAGCFAAAQPGEAHAMRDGYSYLGERWVHGGGQAVHEAVVVGRGDGRFTSVMIVVENAPVEMDEVVITYGDGQQQRVGTRLTFGPNSTSRQIPLEGGARHIQRVDFVFSNIPGDGRAKVELWGR
jgi:hypothetical protein